MSNTGKSSNGGGFNGDGDHDDDDDLRPNPNVIGNKENLRMLVILADYLTEAKTHSAKLTDLYVTVKEMKDPVSPVWTGTLLGEFERHHDVGAKNLGALRAYLQAPTPAGVPIMSDDED